MHPHATPVTQNGADHNGGSYENPVKQLQNLVANGEYLYSWERAPMLVYWEATPACDLACVHCRASAIPQRSPLELSTGEAQNLLRQIASFGTPAPHLVITGGDPLQRPDLFDLIEYGHALGLQISATPAGTRRLTADVVDRFTDAGISSLALSLDGSTAAIHDRFRGVTGSFQWTLDAAHAIVERGVPLQVNTMVTAQTLDDLPAIYETLRDVGITRWALFFLITTGRGRDLSEVTPGQGEKLLGWLTQLSRDAATPFQIKTTEAPHYRRIAFRRMAQRMTPQQIAATPVGRGFGIRDGNGVVFVSFMGQVYPSGFLPLSAGNVRQESLVDVYRNSDLFRLLHDPNQLKGKCGRCAFRTICGGSRARAYAATGDPLESDPLCPYQPPLM